MQVTVIVIIINITMLFVLSIKDKKNTIITINACIENNCKQFKILNISRPSLKFFY